MMSHKQLLLDSGIVTYKKADMHKKRFEKELGDRFMDYKYDEVYQVDVNFIQDQTKLKFMLQLELNKIIINLCGSPFFSVALSGLLAK